jgi:thiol-disulfide isomerase/thioredoxin
MISGSLPVIACMNRMYRSIMPRLVFGAVAVLALLSCGPACAEARADWQPPAFQLSDAHGEPLQYPEGLKGPTVVLFWATWCPYCKALMPHLQSIIDEYGSEIEVLALNFREDGDPAEYLADRGYDFRLFPESDEVAESWGVKGTPGLFLADRTGCVVFSNFTIPREAYPTDPAEVAKQMKHYQKAARKAPFWAALLRQAIDETLAPPARPCGIKSGMTMDQVRDDDGSSPG